MRLKDLLKEDSPCWKDYEMVGMKDKNGKKVPNCVPKNEELEDDDCGCNSVSEAISKHQEKGVPYLESIFRMYSENYFKTILEAKKLYTEGKLENIHKWDKELFESDFGKIGIFEGKNVPLDLPLPITEAEYQGRDVELNKPMRNSGGKKFKVYVKDPKTDNVKKVTFGAAGGGGSLAVKLKDPEAKKSFAARHNCEQTKDKTTAGYWACRLPRYAKSLGLSGGGQWW